LIQGVIPVHLYNTLSNINVSDPYYVGSSIQSTLNAIGVNADTDTYEGTLSARDDLELRRNLRRIGVDVSTNYWSLPLTNPVARATEPVITTKDAMTYHSAILDANGVVRSGTASIATMSNNYYKLVRDFTRTCTIVNMSKLSADIQYESYEQAYDLWQEIQSNIDAVVTDIQAERHYKQDVPIQILTQIADKLAIDIQARAPERKTLKYINVQPEIPSLVLAHRLFGNTDKELGIVARNKLTHPAFISGRIKYHI
jgi:hypothetical protein